MEIFIVSVLGVIGSWLIHSKINFIGFILCTLIFVIKRSGFVSIKYGEWLSVLLYVVFTINCILLMLYW